MKKVYVVCKNDFPDCAAYSEEEAEKLCRKKLRPMIRQARQVCKDAYTFIIIW